MNAMYDLLCSIVIGGILLLMLVGFNGTITEQAGAQTVRMMAQSSLTTIGDLVDYEFRKMGYQVPKGTDSAIVFADTSKITFKADIDNDGTVDILTYQLDSSPSRNANTKTHYLYRIKNGQTELINLGLTQFRITYYDSSGKQLTSYPIQRPSHIKSIKIAMNAESLVPYIERSESYLKASPGAYWEQTIKPRNVR
ncbi:MAG: hypothetical protein AUI33_02805 [Ignavibacteria bacterium 13_1_40CM_2_61_4]|nr:MAG: hypothetical protein AUI33_02805 [Ignavibacteria bacterium 13_1_40CM_2_61_4]